jgi:hypothetical protein
LQKGDQVSASFNSLVTTAVTLPGLAVLAVMALYYLKNRYGSEEPYRWRYLVLALLLPLVILICSWPTRGRYYGDYHGYGYNYNYNHSSDAILLLCLYGAFYVVGLVAYGVSCNVLLEYRQRVFTFFFVTLAAIVMVSMCMTLSFSDRLFYVIGALALLSWLGYQIVKAANELLSGPHRKTMAWMMVTLFMGCLIVYQFNVWYVIVVAFWEWVAVQAMTWHKPPPEEKCDEMQPAAIGEFTPSPSPPSQGID